MKMLKESLLGNAGLGKRGQIEKWLQEIGIRFYNINPDLTIDVKGNVYLWNRDLTEFPSYIQFNNISGYFDCSFNNLTSLRGCPKKVNGVFDCSHNKLESLEYCPVSIKGSFFCNNNEIISLEYCPKEIRTNFDCSNNKLNSLKGCTKLVKGSFDCSKNKLKNFEGCPEKVLGKFVCIQQYLPFFKKDILKYCDVKEENIILSY